MSHRRMFQKYMGRTLINRWDEVSQSTNKFIMDLVKSGSDVSGQLGTDDSSVIAVVHVQVAEGVFGLKKLIL
jgi:hypothetical protein